VTAPHDPRAEISVLALIMSTGQLYRVTDKINADDFYTLVNRTIFSGIVLCDQREIGFDTNAVDAACREISQDWDGWQSIQDIRLQAKRENATAGNLETFADRVAMFSLHRQYLAVNERIREGIMSGVMNQCSVDVFVDSQYQELTNKALSQDSEISPWREDELDLQSVMGISTGYTHMDKHTNGLCPSNLFIITGKSGSGKTTLAMNVVSNVTKRGKVAAVFSIEMPRNQLKNRLIASEAGISLEKLNKGIAKTDPDYLKAKQAFDRIVSDECQYIDDSGSRTVSEIKSQALKVRHRTGRLDLIMIDYLGKIRPEDTSLPRHEQIAVIVQTLAAIGKSLNVCVLLLAQLSRAGELRGSGEIDHEADVIVKIERDEGKPNVAKLNTTKSRHAEPGRFSLTFEGQYNRFVNYAPAGYGEIEYE